MYLSESMAKALHPAALLSLINQIRALYYQPVSVVRRKVRDLFGFELDNSLVNLLQNDTVLFNRTMKAYGVLYPYDTK